jgi:hypothetical protein
MKHRGLIGIGACAFMALGCGKSDNKPAADPTPVTAPTDPPATAPAPTAGKGLVGLFGKKSGEPKQRAAGPISGLFGGGMNVGAGPAMTAAADEDDVPAAPAPSTPPAPQGKSAAPPAGPASASCGKAAAHLAAMIKQEMGSDVPAETLDQMKTEVARQCTADSWPAAAIECVLKSTDLAGLSTCESMLPGGGGGGDDVDLDDGDDEDFDMPDLDLGSGDPVPSGDPRCDAVAAHAWTLLMSDPNMVPADQRATMEGMKVQMVNMIAAECVKQKFTDTVKDCILAAKKITDTEKCGI